MSPERTTEMPSVTWCDSCCVSVHPLFVVQPQHTVGFFPINRVPLPLADYILEHSEDDTKSLFSIIKVSRQEHNSMDIFKS